MQLNDNNCFINSRFDNILVHVRREKPTKDTSEDTSSGKPTEYPEGNTKDIESERAGLGRGVNLLAVEEEKLDNLLWFKTGCRSARKGHVGRGG